MSAQQTDIMIYEGKICQNIVKGEDFTPVEGWHSILRVMITEANQQNISINTPLLRSKTIKARIFFKLLSSFREGKI